jgi:COPII coat assembly protein SEC16
MKNKQEYPYDTPINTQNQSSRRTSVDHDNKTALPVDDVDADKILDNGETNELSKEISESKNEDTTDEDVEDLSKEKSQLSEKEITDKFRNYLLYGNIADALEWATDNNLWGHALFLASKVDRRQHANVMMKFANKLTLNDPLQTLYQLMSGRSPNSVTVSFA